LPKDANDTLADLTDRRPQKTDRSGWEHLPDEIRDRLKDMDWIADAQVRMGEEGHIFLGEAFVVPKPGTADLVRRLGQAVDEMKALDWRVHDIVIMPVESLPEVP
jgi:hypothetical protein